MTNTQPPTFDTHADYRTACSTHALVAALGKRRARDVQNHYPDSMSLADLALEQDIDTNSFVLLDGAWGPKKLTVPMASDFGLRLTDLVISNGATRGIISDEEARKQYVTIGHSFSEWASLCDADTLRMHHRNRVFVLSEAPEAFGLARLWEIGYSLGDLNLGTGPEAFERRTTATDAAEMVTSPFTDAQVAALRAWQNGDFPVRCNQPECALTDPPAMEPHAEGFTCPKCRHIRSWAWRAMTGEDGRG